MNIVTIGSRAYSVSDKVLKELNEKQEQVNESEDNEQAVAELEHYISKVAIQRSKCLGFVLFDYRI